MPATTGRRVTLAMPHGRPATSCREARQWSRAGLTQADKGVAADLVPKVAGPVLLPSSCNA